LINLGSLDDVLLDKSVAALADELKRADLLGADGVVTHVGTTGGTSAEQTAARVAAAVQAAFLVAGDVGCRLLLENTAGAGTTFGNSPEELGAILEELSGELRPRVGVCIDSCHAHAAGYDMSTAEGWTQLVDSVEKWCGAGAIGAVHANDCVFPSGSKKDRHAWIGDGTIGYEGFTGMLCEPRLRSVAAFTEMPGDVPEKDVENLSRLKRLRAGCEGRA
ncbi:MAG: deoxyribonuclease IV, partial [Coriobacteriia bacterium]|nr:deoxyribonuclease IV [Coriobacteriia bacterium]